MIAICCSEQPSAVLFVARTCIRNFISGETLSFSALNIYFHVGSKNVNCVTSLNVDYKMVSQSTPSKGSTANANTFRPLLVVTNSHVHHLESLADTSTTDSSSQVQYTCDFAKTLNGCAYNDIFLKATDQDIRDNRRKKR